jgi:hypothetical protein
MRAGYVGWAYYRFHQPASFSMEFRYGSCVIHATAGIDGGAIVGNARIYPPALDGTEPRSHDMEFHCDFIDEHEAIAFAHERAGAWIDEHWDAELDRPMAV